MATLSAAAAHVYLSISRFRELLEAGVVTKQMAGQYDLDVVRKEVLTRLRSEKAGQGGGGVGLATERAALAREQTFAVQIKNAALRGDLVSLEAFGRIVDTMLTVFRERILSIPGKMADALSMRPREEIEPLLRDELYEALGELSNPAS